MLDVGGDFYGAHVRIDLVARLRETRKFASAEQLSKQLAHDERQARNALSVAQRQRRAEIRDFTCLAFVAQAAI